MIHYPFVASVGNARSRKDDTRRLHSLTRWAGLAAMLGGALAIGAFATLAARPPGVPGGPYRDDSGVGPFLAAALLCIGIGLAGIYGRQGGRGGRLGALGVTLGVGGDAVLLAGSVLLLALDDFPAAPLVVIPAFVALLAGSLLSAVALLRAGALPRPAALALLAASLAFLAFDSESARTWLALPFGAAWVWLGHALWSTPRESAGATSAGRATPTVDLAGR